MGSSGSSGIMIGVATAFAYLYLTVQIMGDVPLLVPLWPIIPLLLYTDLASALRHPRRRHVRGRILVVVELTVVVDPGPWVPSGTWQAPSLACCLLWR
ncbi:hypothetical protein PG996_007787 [Apiospora saccharicola]|uniref:Uncharacterized protein n=1 Tax=Apiospora saccharicola TaxID=335842 RepID=A0ABR1UW28_9PEZI